MHIERQQESRVNSISALMNEQLMRLHYQSYMRDIDANGTFVSRIFAAASKRSLPLMKKHVTR